MARGGTWRPPPAALIVLFENSITDPLLPANLPGASAGAASDPLADPDRGLYLTLTGPSLKVLLVLFRLFRLGYGKILSSSKFE